MKKGNQGSVIIRKGSFRLVARIGKCLALVAIAPRRYGLSKNGGIRNSCGGHKKGIKFVHYVLRYGILYAAFRVDARATNCA